MPKLIDYEALKTMILKNAYRVFLHKGFSDTKMSDISEACNLKRTALYHYYYNKEVIFQETILHIIYVLESDLVALMENGEMSPLQKIKHINQKWEQEFGIKHLKIFFVEVYLKLLRDTSKFFVNLNKKLVTLNSDVIKVFLEHLIDEYNTHTIKNESMISLLNYISIFISENRTLALNR